MKPEEALVEMRDIVEGLLHVIKQVDTSGKSFQNACAGTVKGIKEGAEDVERALNRVEQAMPRLEKSMYNTDGWQYLKSFMLAPFFFSFMGAVMGGMTILMMLKKYNYL